MDIQSLKNPPHSENLLNNPPLSKTMPELTKKRCIPCEGGILLEDLKIKELLKEIPSWSIKNGHLFKQFKFKNFLEAMRFINSIAKIAESEGHHPDFCVHYSRVEIELWTHEIKGISENDFIVAAKIDKLF